MKKQYTGQIIYQRESHRDIREMLQHTCKMHGERLAYIYRDKPRGPETKITYHQLLADINALGTALYRRGWVKDTNVQIDRTHIGVIGPNSYAWAIAHNASVFGAGISVPMDKQLAVPEIINLCERGRVEVLFIDYKMLEEAEKIASALSTIKAFIVLNAPTTDKKGQEIAFADQRFFTLKTLLEEGHNYLAQGDDIFTKQEIDPEALQILSFTSGTTTLAKGVMLPHRAIVNDVTMTLQTVDVNENDRSLSLLPLHHIFECTLGMYAIWSAGGCICICDGLRYIQQNLQEWGITVLLAVPLLMENFYRQIMHKVQQQNSEKKLRKAIKVLNFLCKFGIDLRRRIFAEIHNGLGGKLRYIFVGASALAPEINQFFLDLGIMCYMGYGLTETAPLVCGCNDRTRVPGTVGNPLPGVAIEIRDSDSDQTLSTGEAGEIVVKTPSLMLGYYDDPESTAQAVNSEGWFYTGDIGFFDEKDCLHITGRSKSMIVLTNGKKVFPEEIEFLLNKLPYIKQSLVFGEENKRGTIDICALLQVDEEHLPTDDKERDELFRSAIKEINEQMPVYKKIRFFVWQVRDMISTTTMKIKRQPELEAMRQLLAQKQTSVAESDGKRIDG